MVPVSSTASEGFDGERAGHYACHADGHEPAHHGHGEHPSQPSGGATSTITPRSSPPVLDLAGLGVPVLAFSPMIRDWLGLRDVTGLQQAAAPVFGTVLFVARPDAAEQAAISSRRTHADRRAPPENEPPAPRRPLREHGTGLRGNPLLVAQHVVRDLWLRAAAPSASATFNFYSAANYAGAQHFYEMAVRHFERAARLAPSKRNVLLAQANAYAWLADSFYVRRLWQQSLDQRLRQYPIVERLHRADPSNAENTYRLALAQSALARSLSHVGQADRARSLILEAYGSANRLIQLDPNDAEWFLYKGIVTCSLFYGAFDPPPRTTRSELAQEIRAVDARLKTPKIIHGLPTWPAVSANFRTDSRGLDFERTASCQRKWRRPRGAKRRRRRKSRPQTFRYFAFTSLSF